MKKSIIKIIACLFVASMLLPANAVSAEAASQNQKALKAYEKILSNPTYSWSSLSNENKTKDYKFACEDLNGDGVKELILYNPTASYGSGYVKILMYVNNKVKLVSTNSGFGWYKKRKIIQAAIKIGKAPKSALRSPEAGNIVIICAGIARFTTNLPTPSKTCSVNSPIFLAIKPIHNKIKKLSICVSTT